MQTKVTTTISRQQGPSIHYQQNSHRKDTAHPQFPFPFPRPSALLSGARSEPCPRSLCLPLLALAKPLSPSPAYHALAAREPLRTRARTASSAAARLHRLLLRKLGVVVALFLTQQLLVLALQLVELAL
eukprot:5604116-Pleurochrysis_carterae.AAC.4